MKLLIAVSSKYGSTLEIADAMAETIRGFKVDVVVADARTVASIAGYDAVIVGSALHLGRWMEPARSLVTQLADEFRARPTWLFASGPLGPNVDDPYDRAEGLRLLELVGARDAQVFSGKVEKRDLNLLERGMVSMVKNPWGDHRDWVAISTWAEGIARSLVGELSPAGR